MLIRDQCEAASCGEVVTGSGHGSGGEGSRSSTAIGKGHRAGTGLRKAAEPSRAGGKESGNRERDWTVKATKSVAAARVGADCLRCCAQRADRVPEHRARQTYLANLKQDYGSGIFAEAGDDRILPDLPM